MFNDLYSIPNEIALYLYEQDLLSLLYDTLEACTNG